FIKEKQVVRVPKKNVRAFGLVMRWTTISDRFQVQLESVEIQTLALYHQSPNDLAPDKQQSPRRVH
ncbi:MAG: hypothetical protein WCO34_07630, partial [Betaproteobacteria bacterium]